MRFWTKRKMGNIVISDFEVLSRKIWNPYLLLIWCCGVTYDKFHSVSHPVYWHGWSVPTRGKHTLQQNSIALVRTIWVWLEWLPILNLLVCGWCFFLFRFRASPLDMRFIWHRSVQRYANITREATLAIIHSSIRISFTHPFIKPQTNTPTNAPTHPSIIHSCIHTLFNQSTNSQSTNPPTFPSTIH